MTSIWVHDFMYPCRYIFYLWCRYILLKIHSFWSFFCICRGSLYKWTGLNTQRWMLWNVLLSVCASERLWYIRWRVWNGNSIMCNITRWSAMNVDDVCCWYYPSMHLRRVSVHKYSVWVLRNKLHVHLIWHQQH